MSSTRSRDRDVSIRLMRQYNYRSEELICNKAMEEDTICTPSVQTFFYWKLISKMGDVGKIKGSQVTNGTETGDISVPIKTPPLCDT